MKHRLIAYSLLLLLVLLASSCQSIRYDPSKDFNRCHWMAQAQSDLVVPYHDTYGKKLVYNRALSYCLSNRSWDGRLWD